MQEQIRPSKKRDDATGEAPTQSGADLPPAGEMIADLEQFLKQQRDDT